MTALSIIVPTYNSSSTLHACLSHLRDTMSSNDELIVVDDGSQSPEKVQQIAQSFTDQLLRHDVNRGLSEARNTGAKQANHSIYVFIDSDCVVQPQTLNNIRSFFDEHPEVDALTGKLALEHPNTNFSSLYKNAYMHFIFSQLPEKVNFLYGSVHAIRKMAFHCYGEDVEVAEDAALGQRLTTMGKIIQFVKGIEVVHLKKYSLKSLLINDFKIPYYWVKLFFVFKGWKQLGRRGTGFQHAPLWQLISLILAPLTLIGMLLSAFMFGLCLVMWLVLNLKFFLFLKRNFNISFALKSIITTYVDHLVMFSGICVGVLSVFMGHRFLRRPNTTTD